MLEAHLAECPECAGTLDQLRMVVARAAALQPTRPSSDLWPGIEARVDVGTSGAALPRARCHGVISFTLPQLVAAGLALMVLSGGAVWLSQFGGRTTSLPPVAASDPQTTPAPAVTPVGLTNPRYDQAVRRARGGARRRAIAARSRDREDPRSPISKRSIRRSSSRAGRSKRIPANIYLYSHLAEARQRKLALLRRASALVGPKG